MLIIFPQKINFYTIKGQTHVSLMRFEICIKEDFEALCIVKSRDLIFLKQLQGCGCILWELTITLTKCPFSFSLTNEQTEKWKTWSICAESWEIHVCQDILPRCCQNKWSMMRLFSYIQKCAVIFIKVKRMRYTDFHKFSISTKLSNNYFWLTIFKLQYVYTLNLKKIMES